MNKKIILFLFTALAVLPGCKKNAAVDVKEWTQFQDQFFKVSFNYPKDWVVVTESKKVTISSSAEAAEKFFDHDSRKPDGIQIVIASVRSDSLQDYTKYIEEFKNSKTAEGFTVKEIEDATIEGLGAKKVAYSGAYDENTKIHAIYVATLKDSTIYYVQYSAFNNMLEPNKFVFDSLMASLSLPKKIIIEKGIDPAIPIAQTERYSDNNLQLEHPANFGASDVAKKGDVISAVRFMGTNKDSRNDCTIDIDVRPAKKLSLEKVVDQNSKFFKASSKGNTTIGGEKAIYLDYSLVKNVDSRVYFIVKNDKIFRIFLNYYSPMKKDFLPAFEKVIASIRFK
ncbi:MAG: PsbP-related protein [Bacteroidota bacterium]